MKMINTTASNIINILGTTGWKVEIEDDDADFKHYYCTREGVFVPSFTLLEIILMSPISDSADDGTMLYFLFHANPAELPEDRQKFGRLLRKEYVHVMQTECDKIIQMAKIITDEASVTINHNPRNSRIRFDGEIAVYPAYTIEVSYAAQDYRL